MAFVLGGLMYPIPCFYNTIINKIAAQSITLQPIGIALKGSSKKLAYAVSPEGADIYDITFEANTPDSVSVNKDGEISFISEGYFSILMTAKTVGDITLSDVITGNVEELRLDVDPIGNRSIGDRFWFVYRGDPSFDPGNPSPNMVGFDVFPPEIMEEDDFSVYGFAETPNIISMAPSGIFTCISSGEAQCGLKGTYKDVSATHKETVTVV
ncbi:hypothetical protein KQM40_003733 [Escherichia coli]|nr:hypothetical protein [Escherichia coli]